MAERQTRVTLVAQVTGYLAGMEQARAKTAENAKEGAKLEAQLRKQHTAMTELGVGAAAFGGVALAAVGLAVAKFAEFDQAVSGVQAATHESAANMALLRDAALDAGASTVYSATEAANAIEELAKAGLSTADILNGGLSGALDLAAAGGLEVADAAEKTAVALKQFGLNGGDATHVADLLAAGAGKAVGDVADLSGALNQVGLVANGAGQSIEDTTGVLAAFADQGLLGSDAGTSLKSALIALQAPTGKAREEMEKYNLSFYDGNGQMLSFTEIAGQLSSRLGGLDDETRNAALATIFGNDAIRSANVLYGQGAEGIQKYIDQTNDSGYAAETARIKLDNLAGDVEKLGGAFDTGLIKSGSGANEILREMVQSATFLVDGISSLPQPVLNAGLAVAALGGGIALAGGASLVAVPRLAAFKANLETMGVSAKGATLAIAGIGGAVALATVGASILIARSVDISSQTQELADTLDKATGAMTEYTRQTVVRKLAEADAYGAAKEAGVSQKELTDAVLEGGDALDEIIGKLNDNNTAVSFFNGTGIAAGLATDEILKTAEAVEGSGQAFADSAAATDGATESTASNTAALQDLQGAAQNGASELDDLKAAIEGFGSAQLDVNSSTRHFEAAVDDLTASVTENGTSLDVGTDKGRANQAALDAIASSALGVASATLTQTGSQDAATRSLEGGRAKLIEALGAFGITGRAAEDYADQLGLIPSNISTAVAVTGAQTAEAIIAQVARDRTANILIRAQDATPQSGGTTRPGFAAGGAVAGSGPVGVDSVPAWLAPGEHVLTVSDVNNLGGQGNVYAFRNALSQGMDPWAKMMGSFANDTARGYASGGAVQPGTWVTSGMPQSAQFWQSAPAPTMPSGPIQVVISPEQFKKLGATFNIQSPANPVAVAQAVSTRQNAFLV